MNFIELTHSTFNTKVSLVVEQIAFMYYSQASESTHVVATGGAAFPAKESVSTIKSLIDSAKSNIVEFKPSLLKGENENE